MEPPCPALTDCRCSYPQGEGVPGAEGTPFPLGTQLCSPCSQGNPSLSPEGSLGGVPRQASRGISSQAPRG